MNKNELKTSLELLGISQNRYSLNGDLNPDSIVLFHNYSNWEVFISTNEEAEMMKKFLSLRMKLAYISMKYLKMQKIKK